MIQRKSTIYQDIVVNFFLNYKKKQSKLKICKYYHQVTPRTFGETTTDSYTCNRYAGLRAYWAGSVAICLCYFYIMYWNGLGCVEKITFGGSCNTTVLWYT